MKSLLAGVFWPYPQLAKMNKLTFFQRALNEIFFFSGFRIIAFCFPIY